MTMTTSPRALQDDVLRCRTYGHAWDEFRPTGVTAQADLTLRCTRCVTLRFDVVDAEGTVTRRRYQYPSEYRSARLKRTDLRVELLRRLKRARS